MSYTPESTAGDWEARAKRYFDDGKTRADIYTLEQREMIKLNPSLTTDKHRFRLRSVINNVVGLIHAKLELWENEREANKPSNLFKGDERFPDSFSNN